MPLGNLVDTLSPLARVATAVIPFLLALVLRLLLGKNRATRIALSVATVWFSANVLLAPYSLEMRREIFRLGTHLR